MLGKDEECTGIKRALLEVIASGVVTRPRDVERYAACTFFASSSSQEDASATDSVIKRTVQFLVANEFVRLQCCDNTKEDERNEGRDPDRVSSFRFGASVCSLVQNHYGIINPLISNITLQFLLSYWHTLLIAETGRIS